MAAQPSPFHGYYFKILTAQGPPAPGGATDYVAERRAVAADSRWWRGQRNMTSTGS